MTFHIKTSEWNGKVLEEDSELTPTIKKYISIDSFVMVKVKLCVQCWKRHNGLQMCDYIP